MVEMSLRAASLGRTVSASIVSTNVTDSRNVRSPKRWVKLVSVHPRSIAVELDERTTLALPSHPRLLGLVEGPAANEEVERALSVLGVVSLVECLDALARYLDDRLVALGDAARRHLLRSPSSPKARFSSRLAR